MRDENLYLPRFLLIGQKLSLVIGCLPSKICFDWSIIANFDPSKVEAFKVFLLRVSKEIRRNLKTKISMCIDYFFNFEQRWRMRKISF